MTLNTSNSTCLEFQDGIIFSFFINYDGWVREFIESTLITGWEDNKTT